MNSTKGLTFYLHHPWKPFMLVLINVQLIVWYSSTSGTLNGPAHKKGNY